MELNRIEKEEHLKYTRLHIEGYGSTGYQKHLSAFVQWTAKRKDKILDLGCGCGIAVKYLLEAHYNVMGVDITLSGVTGDLKRFAQAPLWSLPFPDNGFEYTYSSDVLEHIRPDLVDGVLEEIYRITERYTLHVICTKPSVYESGLHPTVRTISWWRAAFKEHNVHNIDAHIVNTNQFMKLYQNAIVNGERVPA